MSITALHDALLNALVEDGPFDGFLPGYDNLPFDAEDALGLDLAALTAAKGQYDTGQPMVDHFLRAQFLALLLSPSPEQEAELTTLLALINHHLFFDEDDPDALTLRERLAATTLLYFLAEMDSDPFAEGGTPPTFGRPKRGHAIGTTQTTVEGPTTAIQEGFSVQILDEQDGFDTHGFGVGPMDAYGGRTALMFPMDLPPIGVHGVDFDSTETPLDVGDYKVGTFDITFANAPPLMPVPTIEIWRPSDTSPQPVGVVQVISNGRFRFIVPVPTEAKVVVS